MAQPRTLLVTVGSTLFMSLTNKVLSPSILSILPALGFELLVIQYGSADLLSLTDIEDLEVDSRGSGEFVWRDYNGLGEVRVRVTRYTDDFLGLVASAHAVISHAGGYNTSNPD
jgi:UDP-N-acetylglucosamine transferase subunit ALG13